MSVSFASKRDVPLSVPARAVWRAPRRARQRGAGGDPKPSAAQVGAIDGDSGNVSGDDHEGRQVLVRSNGLPRCDGVALTLERQSLHAFCAGGTPTLCLLSLQTPGVHPAPPPSCSGFGACRCGRCAWAPLTMGAACRAASAPSQHRCPRGQACAVVAVDLQEPTSQLPPLTQLMSCAPAHPPQCPTAVSHHAADDWGDADPGE